VMLRAVDNSTMLARNPLLRCDPLKSRISGSA